MLCSDVFGNFFVQRIIESANLMEQRWISTRLLNKMNTLCLNRYSCRVVQKAIEVCLLNVLVFFNFLATAFRSEERSSGRASQS